MSGDGKRSVAEWPKLPRPSSTLPLALSLLAVCEAAVAVGSGVLGVEPDRRAQVRHGAVVFTLREVHVAPAVVSILEVGIEADRLIKVGHGAVVVAPGE